MEAPHRAVGRPRQGFIQHAFFYTLISHKTHPTLGLLIAATLRLHVAHAQEDPAAEGPHAVSVAEYGSFSFPASMFIPPVGLDPNFPHEWLAEVHFPSDLNNGPYPLVLFLHGKSNTCYALLGTATSDWGWDFNNLSRGPCPAGLSPVPSYKGFSYLAFRLASHGMIVASISANGANAADDSINTERKELIRAHLNAFATFNTSGSTVFSGPGVSGTIVGNIDMQNIGLAGHSQGGRAIVQFYDENPEFGIQALLPIANASSVAVNDVPIAALLSYCDGDVERLPGLNLLDNARYNQPSDEAPKYTFLALGGNHKYFNLAWSPHFYHPSFDPVGVVSDDALGKFPGDSHCDTRVSGHGRLSVLEQTQAARAYVLAFFRRHLLGESEFDAYLSGDVLPPPTSVTSDVRVGYFPGASDRRDLNRLDDAQQHDQGVNTLGGTVVDGSMTTSEICGAPGTIDCIPSQVRDGHDHARLRLRWLPGAQVYSNQLPLFKRDVSNFTTLQFRASVDFSDALNIGSERNFRVKLSDGGGRNASVLVSDFSDALFFPPGSSIAPVDSTPVRMSVMSTVRIPLEAFVGVDHTNIQQVDFVFNVSPSGAIHVSDLAFSDEGLSVAEIVAVSR